MTPPKREKIRRGAPKALLTSPSARGESVISATSQPRAIICIFIAIEDAVMLIQNQRKLLILSEAKVLRQPPGGLSKSALKSGSPISPGLPGGNLFLWCM
jgi:hypothetical protein